MAGEAFEQRPDVYDALIDWPARLANEAPFYRALFERMGVRSVLDVACGTGRHAALFHSWGCRVEGADASPAMVEYCRSRFGQSDSLRWSVRAFDQPHGGSFDAVICVGNSLALASEPAEVERAVRQMLAALRPGGACVIQVLNLGRLPDGPTVWQKCKRVRLSDGEHLLVKGVHRAGRYGFVDLVDIVISADPVRPRFETATFLDLEPEELVRMARAGGARHVMYYGNFQGASFDRKQSQDLLMVAQSGQEV